MKKGLLLILLVFALAPAVLATNKSVGTFKEVPGENFTVDGIPGQIIQREELNPDFIYLALGNQTEYLHKTECKYFGIYSVCFRNSTEYTAFDPEIKATPYEYELKIRAITPTIKIEQEVSETKVLVGQRVKAKVTVRNEGPTSLEKLRLEIPVEGFDTSGLSNECVREGDVISYEGPLFTPLSQVCAFDMRAREKTKLTFRPVVTFFDGRKNVTVRGSSKTIDATRSAIEITFENASLPVGSWVKGNITLENDLVDRIVVVEGDVQTELLFNGTTHFRKGLGLDEKEVFPFVMQLQHVGNTTLHVAARWEQFPQDIQIGAEGRIEVVPLDVRISTFGRLDVPDQGTGKLIVEVQNAAAIPIRNVSLSLASESISLPAPTVTADIPAESTREFYNKALTFKVNDRYVPINITVTYSTGFGEEFTVTKEVEYRVGTPPTKTTRSTRRTAPTRTTRGNKTTVRTTTTKTTTRTTRKATKPELAREIEVRERTATGFLAVLVGIVIGGSVAWLVYQARKRKPTLKY